MSENKFDQTIADQLRDLEMPYEPASWDLLQSKLDHLAAPTPQPEPPTPQPSGGNAFDQRMKAMLEEVDMPYQSAHWERMSAQLDNAGAERHIRRYKISEAAAVLLLALAFQAALNSGNTWFKMPRQQQTEPQEKTEMANKAKKQRQNTANGTIASSVVVPATLPTLPLPTAVANNTPGTASANNAYASDNITNILAAAVVPTPNQGTATQTTLNGALIGPNGLPIVPKGLRPLTLLAALGLDQLPFPQPTLPAMASLSTQPTQRHHDKHAKTYLMAYGGTEKQRYQGSDNYSTEYQTANVGLKLGRRKGNWGMELGLEHTPLAFRPEDETIAFHKDNNKTFATKYSKVRASIVSVPANVTRQITKVGKTSLHAVAGVAAHFATNKSYNFEEVEVPTSPSTQGNKPPLPDGKGLLEGSTLYGNSYATANAGLRIEHRVGRRTTAYVEPQVRRFMGGRGVGPNRGKTNTIGVQAGVLAMIGS